MPAARAVRESPIRVRPRTPLGIEDLKDDDDPKSCKLSAGDEMSPQPPSAIAIAPAHIPAITPIPSVRTEVIALAPAATKPVGTSKARVIAVEKVGNPKIQKKVTAMGTNGDSSHIQPTLPPQLPLSSSARRVPEEQPKEMVIYETNNYCVKLPGTIPEFVAEVGTPFLHAPPNATLQFISGDEKEESSDRVIGEGSRSSAEKKGRRSRSRSPVPSRSRSRSRSGARGKRRDQNRTGEEGGQRPVEGPRTKRSPERQQPDSSAASSSGRIRAPVSRGLSIRVQDLKLLYNLQHLEAIKFAILCLAPFARASADVDDFNVSIGHIIMEHNQRSPKYYSAQGALKYWNDEVFHEKITLQSVTNFHTNRLRDAGAREDRISAEVDGTLKDLAALGYACRCLARDLCDRQRALPARHD